MTLMDLLTGRWRNATAGVGPRPIPITRVELDGLKPGLREAREWVCRCGAKLRIRSRIARNDERSNFNGTRPDIAGREHSVIPAEQLNWNGLAEERGWALNPIRCPACQNGLSLDSYKQARREGRLGR